MRLSTSHVARKSLAGIAVAILYYGLAALGLRASFEGSPACPVWPAAGFALAAVVVLGPAALPAVALGSFAANAAAFSGQGAAGALCALVIGLGSALQAWIGARLLGPYLDGPEPLSRSSHVAAFAALAPAACLVSATIGVAAASGLALLPVPLAGRAWLTWWAADSLGALIVAPLLLAWRPRPDDELGQPPTLRLALEAAAAAAALVGCGWLAFGDALRWGDRYPLAFLPIPALLWMTLRLGSRGATTAAAALAALVQWNLLRGEGPLSMPGAPVASLLVSSAFLAMTALTALLLRAVLAERRAAELRLEEARAALARRVDEQEEDIHHAADALREAAAGRRRDNRRLELYRHFVDELPVGVAVVRLDDLENPRTWRVVEMNPAGLRLAGAQGPVPARRLAELAGEVLDTELPRACAEALRRGAAVSLPDFTPRGRPLSERFAVNVFPLEDRQVGVVFENVASRKAAEDALRRSEEQLRLMVESVEDYAIFRLDAKGRVASWNKGAQRITGYAAEEALGKGPGFLAPPGEASDAAAALARAARDGSARSEGWRARRDGSRFWTDSIVTALKDDKGRVAGYVKVLRDGTERRAIHQALQDRTRALAKSNAELTEFAYVASHDLQAPLRKASAFAEQLRRSAGETLDPQGRDFMERLLRSIQSMQALIDGLLQLSRVRSSEAPMRRVSLADVATLVLEELEPAIRESGARISVDRLPEVEADPQQMRQLLQNLLANALKFRRPGRPPEIRVAARDRADGMLELSVSDNGVGFEMKYAGRIFQPFQRLHSVKDFPGTGMGLAICQKIVERHGGTIAADSSPERGSVFTVVLPARRPAEAAL